MGMNLVRIGSSAVVGVASGALENRTPLVLGTTSVRWSTVAEGVALVGGAVMQLLSPFTMANMVDGLVDGGVALLAARGTKYAMAQTGAGAMYGAHYGAHYGSPYLANPAAAYGGLASPCARGAVGNVGNAPKKELV